MKLRLLTYILPGFIFCASHSALQAADAIWTGAADAVWNNSANWNPSGPPNTAGNLATFNNNVNTSIALPAALSSINILFADSAATGAYTLGALPSGPGSSTTTLSPGSGWNVTAGVSGSNLLTTTQTFNANISLGTRGSNANIALINNSAAADQRLIINGNITGNNSGAGTWQVQLRGNGIREVNGIISDLGTTATSVSAAGGGVNLGTTFLNGVNTYAGGTILGGGAGRVVLGNKSALGTGLITINGVGAAYTISAGTNLTGANAVTNAVSYTGTTNSSAFSGANNMEFSGNVNLNATATSGSNSIQVDSGTKTIFSGVLSQTTATTLAKTGAGVLVLSGANTFTGNVSITGGTLLLNNATGSATGTAGLTTANSGGTLGGKGFTSGLIAIASGGSFRPGEDTGNSTSLLTSTSTGNSALILNAGSTTLFDINGTSRGNSVAGYDAFDTSGRVTYGGDFTINYNLAAPGGASAYDLFGFAQQAGSFTSVSITGLYTSNLTLSTNVWTGASGDTAFSFNQLTGDLTVTSVPESGTVAILAVALALGTGFRRSRQRA